MSRVIHFLGSMRVGLANFIVFTAAVLALRVFGGSPTWVLAVPLAVLALGVVCAILSRPHFRAQPYLVVFHAALVALVALFGISRLTYFEGGFEVTRGLSSDGALVRAESGPLHHYTLDRIRLTNLVQEIDYIPGPRLAGIYNRVQWRVGESPATSATIADVQPLIIDGYRIYATPNNGFALLFVWRPDDGSEPVAGSVHLPAFPRHRDRQSGVWSLPGGAGEVFVELEFDAEAMLDQPGRFTLRPPAEHLLVLRQGDQRITLHPGEAARLPGGEIRYVGVDQWMGYRVFHDPVMAWSLAAALLMVAGLALHFRRRFRDFQPGPRAPSRLSES